MRGAAAALVICCLALVAPALALADSSAPPVPAPALPTGAMPSPPDDLTPPLDPWSAQAVADARRAAAERARAAALLPAGAVVGGVRVGGLSRYAAYRAVRAAFARPLTVRVGRRVLRVAPARLGGVAYVLDALRRARANGPAARVPLTVRVQGAPLAAWVDALAPTVEQPALDARLRFVRAVPRIVPERPGATLDRPGARRALVRALVQGQRSVTLPLRPVEPRVGAADFGPVVVIRRSSKHLILYRGTKVARTFGVATGQSIYPTPLGRFSVAVKWRNPWWYPPDSAWAKGLEPVPPGPGNPLGTRWMGITSPGVGIHGTPDDASIGYSASHGCVRMHISDAEWLFEHVDVGTPVYIAAV